MPMSFQNGAKQGHVMHDISLIYINKSTWIFSNHKTLDYALVLNLHKSSYQFASNLSHCILFSVIMFSISIIWLNIFENERKFTIIVITATAKWSREKL